MYIKKSRVATKKTSIIYAKKRKIVKSYKYSIKPQKKKRGRQKQDQRTRETDRKQELASGQG